MRVDYIVSEYCPGSFSHLIESGELTFDQIQFYFRQICCGILWLNHKNIVHRDLKPDNILYVTNPDTGENTIKIIDFGFSRTLYCDVRTMSRLGTMLYMAPEVYSRSGDHYKADLWSAGVILAQMIIPDKIAYFDPFTFTRSDFPPGVPDGCFNLLKALLTKDPKTRISWDYLSRDKWLDLSPEEIIPPHPQVFLMSSGSCGSGADESSPTLGPAVEPDPFAELFKKYVAYLSAIVYAANSLEDKEAMTDAIGVYVFGASVGSAFYDEAESSVVKLAACKADARYKGIQDMVAECVDGAANVAALVGMDAEVKDTPEKVVFYFALGVAKEGLHYEGLYCTTKAVKLYEKSKSLLDAVVEFSKGLENNDRVIIKGYAETIGRRISLLNSDNCNEHQQ